MTGHYHKMVQPLSVLNGSYIKEQECLVTTRGPANTILSSADESSYQYIYIYMQIIN